jgi:putative membrane protein
MSGGPLFDPGLQPERTALAWRRTTLSLAVGGFVALRLLPPVLGTWSLLAGFGGMAVAGMIWTLARRRAERTSRALLGSTESLPDAVLLLLLALVVSAGAALGLLYIALSRH